MHRKGSLILKVENLRPQQTRFCKENLGVDRKIKYSKKTRDLIQSRNKFSPDLKKYSAPGSLEKLSLRLSQSLKNVPTSVASGTKPAELMIRCSCSIIATFAQAEC